MAPHASQLLYSLFAALLPRQAPEDFWYQMLALPAARFLKALLRTTRKHQFPKGHRRKRALLVGINYSDDDPVMSLHGSTHADVRNMRDMLIKTCKWEKEDITTHLTALFEDSGPDDQRVLLMAGHAYLDGTNLNQTAIMTVETNGETGSLMDQAIRKLMDTWLQKGVDFTAIVDTCYSASLLNLPYRISLEDDQIIYQAVGGSPADMPGQIVCIAACEADKTALMVQDDNDPSQRAGLLTSLIISYLQRSDIQRPFSLCELAKHLMAAIDRLGAAQMPVITCGNMDTRYVPIA